MRAGSSHLGRALRRGLALGSGVAAATLTGRISRASGAVPTDDLKFKSTHVGQLGPPRPSVKQIEEGVTACGNLSSGEGIVMQRGPFGSIWIRPDCVSGSLSGLLSCVEETLASQAKIPAAVYVALPEQNLERAHIRSLLDRGFAYHHYRAQVRRP